MDINFPLRIDFTVSYRFWNVVYLFSFGSRYFLISSLTSSLTHWFFSSMLFSSMFVIGF